MIHPLVSLGERVTLYHNVTLGTKSLGLPGEVEKGLPVIEDDVVLCCNAVVLGPVRIGRGPVVGANALVTKDVPAGAVVVGVNQISHLAECT